MDWAIIGNFGLFLVSLAVLIKGSDWFVDAAEQIGLSFGVSPFIIGVTIVAAGTSLPELAAGISSVFQNVSEVVISSVVGSNIVNILLVISLTTLIGKEIVLEKEDISINIPILAGSAFMLWFAVNDAHFAPLEGILFLLGLVVFLFNSVSDRQREQKARSKLSPGSYALLVIGGSLVYFGADQTVHAIKRISELVEIDPEMIGLTVLALGTSLPEVVVSITAARKGKTAIAVGNVLGSNIFNTFACVGIPALFGTLVIPREIIALSIPFMAAVTVLFALSCLTRRISKWEALIYLIIYILYLYEIWVI